MTTRNDRQTAESFIELFRALKRFFRQQTPVSMGPGVSDEKLRCLASLHFNGKSHLNDLAAFDGLSPSSQCILLGQLVKEGLALRSEDEIDHRKVFYELTESGKALVEEAQFKRIRILNKLLEQLDDLQRERLDDSLATLLGTLELFKTNKLEETGAPNAK